MPTTFTRPVNASVLPLINRVCRRIPPLWDLNNFVAVNPFLGYAEVGILHAAKAIRQGLDAELLPPLTYYQQRYREGAFGEEELTLAAARTSQNAKQLQAILEGTQPMPMRSIPLVRCLAERYDCLHVTQLHRGLLRWLTRWLPTFVTQGGPHWSTASTPGGLFAAWKAAAAVDATPSLLGLKGWSDYLASLPAEPLQTISELLERLDLPMEQREEYLYRLLGTLYGWSSYLRRESWQSGHEPGPLADLLAVRLSMDAAVAELLDSSVNE
ncbi:MAG: putative inorganic carbon transporter subunit DabA, partial [Gemmataceae bacterium]